MTSRPAAQAGTLTLGNTFTVNRLGFGAMRITGAGVWGAPADFDECRWVLTRALELGVNFIDTADSYGPSVSEEIIAAALPPYPQGLVIATKAGFVRPGPGVWKTNGRPEHLRAACEGSLRRLRVETIDLFQLHRIDPDAFIPWYPLGAGKLSDGSVGHVARRHHAYPMQVAIAWLLARSPMMLPIPGTSKVAHLEENVAAAMIRLSDSDRRSLT